MYGYMHGYSKLTVFLELRSWKTVRFLEQIMSADKYPCIFSCQMEAIVYLSGWCDVRSDWWQINKYIPIDVLKLMC